MVSSIEKLARMIEELNDAEDWEEERGVLQRWRDDPDVYIGSQTMNSGRLSSVSIYPRDAALETVRRAGDGRWYLGGGRGTGDTPTSPSPSSRRGLIGWATSRRRVALFFAQLRRLRAGSLAPLSLQLCLIVQPKMSRWPPQR